MKAYRLFAFALILMTGLWSAGAQNLTDYTQPFDADDNTIFLFHMQESEAGAAYVTNSGPSQWNAWATAVNADAGSQRDATSVPSLNFGTSVYLDGGDGTATDWPRIDTLVTEQAALDTFENATGQLTLEAWINPDQVTGIQRIISRANTYFLYLNGDKLEAWFNYADDEDSSADAVTLTVSDVNIPAGQWTHVAAVWNEPALSLWINGEQVEIALYPDKGDLRQPTVSDWLLLGSAPWTGDGFHGYLDEVRISKTARYAGYTPVTELNNNYTRPYFSDATTAFLFHMDSETTDDNFVANSGPSEWGAWADALLASPGCDRQYADVPGSLFGASIYTTGGDGTGTDWPRVSALVTDQAAIDNFESYDGQITLEAWINPDETTGTQRIVARNHTFFLYLEGANPVVWVDMADGEDSFDNGVGLLADNVTIPAGQWTHVAGVWESPTLSIWINGEKQAEADFPEAGAMRQPTVSDWMMVGSAPWPGESFKGAIDEVRVSTIARFKDPVIPTAAGRWTMFE